MVLFILYLVAILLLGMLGIYRTRKTGDISWYTVIALCLIPTIPFVMVLI